MLPCGILCANMTSFIKPEVHNISPRSQLPATVVGSMHNAWLMPTEACGNYLPEPPYLRETKTYHSQPLESTRHAGNYFFPISIRPIFIFCCCRTYVKLLDYWRAEKNLSTSGGSFWGLRPVAFATSATWLVRHWAYTKTSWRLDAVLFCDGTSRYGVPENLTTG